MERNRIKSEIQNIDVNRWWGDDFDVRFYLISKSKNISNKKILDVGGGLGIISGELNDSNFRYNLDYSFDDLKKCITKVNQKINPIMGDMTVIPCKDNYFDSVISSSVLQYSKSYDLQKKNIVTVGGINQYPTVEKVLAEIYIVLAPKGKLYLVTPNNSYYKSYMLDYNEIKKSFSNHFNNVKIYFYNTFPRLSSRYRKLNLANTMPKLMTKIYGREKIIQSLIHKDNGVDKYSVSFFVEAEK